MEPFQIYPSELRRAESAAIHERRTTCGLPVGDAADGQLPKDTLGLGLSGGGIRSATFNLGMLQALAKHHLLRRVDVLSTISGGGYIGCFLGRFFDRLRGSPVPPADLVEGALVDPQSPEITWLRRHGNYIAPNGKSDLHTNLGIFFRNFLTLHLVVGLIAFVAFGVANTLRYDLLEKVSAVFPYIGGLDWADMPLGHLVEAGGLGAFWSPWFMLFELVLLVFIIPRGIGYWLVSPRWPERYNCAILGATFFVLTVLLSLTVRNGWNTTTALAAVPLLASFLFVEHAWWQVRLQNAAVGTGGDSIERLRARAILTLDLGLWLALGLSLLGFAFVDTAAHAVYEAYLRHNQSYLAALAQVGAVLVGLLPVLQFTARMVSQWQSKNKNPSSLTRWLSLPAVNALVAVMLIAPPTVVVCLLSHATFGGGDTPRRGEMLVLGGLFLSILFAFPVSLPFINRSSLNQTYAARLAGAYLGASNPLRQASRNRMGRDIDQVMPGDDTDSLTAYQPFKAGGPLHLLGTCVNETVDQLTLRESRDRLGNILAVSPLGLSIGRYWHGLWDAPQFAVGQVPGTAHPLLDIRGNPPPVRPSWCGTQERLESMPLRRWMAISGAAFGSGMGQHTSLALSFLFTMSGLRTGYWWDTGLSAADRGMRPHVSFSRRLLWLLPHIFPTQSCLLDEALARFPGPWSRLWYLSDGGHFENLGAYELVRRRVPYMIVIDAGADSDYDFDDFANFQRKVRIDFQAQLDLFTDQEWNDAVDRLATTRPGASKDAKQQWREYFRPVRDQLAVPGPHGGTFDEMTPTRDADGRITEPAKKCAALFRINYPDTDTSSVLLYVKATLLGDEPPNVRNYMLENPDFPHQSTADQFFDEAQWESYRQLGEHLGSKIFLANPPPDGTSGNPFWLTLLAETD